MAMCGEPCCHGTTCRRNDEHGDLHVCGRGCDAVCPKCHHPNILHRDNGEGDFLCGERLSYDNNDFCHCSYGAPPQLEEGEPPLATFYAVRNAKGEYYRTYSSAGRSAGWVKELGTARIYAKLGMARGKVTTLANQNPKAPVNDVVEFVVNEVRVIDQRDRVARSQQKKVADALRKKLGNEAYWKKVAVVAAQKALDEATAELARLTGGHVGRRHEADCGCKSCMGM